ncbi:MAG: hypothetical protein HGA67_03085 [Candidatus Yonathbacteria bacterium]|nr:hypothetical protein [Candidatus Yonathbacteria bacterium]
MKKIEPCFVLGPIEITPVDPRICTNVDTWRTGLIRKALEHFATLQCRNPFCVDVCFIRKDELLALYNTKSMSMLDMCMYVINHCGDEGGRLCPRELWPLFASMFDGHVGHTPRDLEYVSLMTLPVEVPVAAPGRLGTVTPCQLAWRISSQCNIELLLPQYGMTYEHLAYVRVRKESISGLKLSRFSEEKLFA